MNIPDFEGERHKQRIKNWEQNVISKTQIKTFCKNTGKDYDAVMKKIDADMDFRWFFVIDPIRQNIHEKTFGMFIRKIKNTKNIKKFWRLLISSP